MPGGRRGHAATCQQVKAASLRPAAYGSSGLRTSELLLVSGMVCLSRHGLQQISMLLYLALYLTCLVGVHLMASRQHACKLLDTGFNRSRST